MVYLSFNGLTICKQAAILDTMTDFALYKSQIFDGPQGAQGAVSSATGSWLNDELDFIKTQQGPTGPFTDLFSAEKGFTQQGTTGP